MHLPRARSLARWGKEGVAARAYDAFAIAPLRIEILRCAFSRNEISGAEVMNEFELTRKGAVQNLKWLEQAGLLSCRHCTHPRGGDPITYWRAERARADDLLDSLLDRLFGTAAETLSFGGSSRR